MWAAKVSACLISVRLILLSIISAQVIELDDSFTEKRKDDPFLVEFYAPWCGHCKKLEPVYHQVSLMLRNSPIHVAKLDATRHSSVASEFEVKGYPTIKFIQGDNVYTHRGDRSREGIVEFAKRAHGPRVRVLRNVARFHDAKGEHADGVFFLFVGSLEDEHNSLFRKYKACSEKYAVQAYFYGAEHYVLPEDIKLKQVPTILALKDHSYVEYEVPDVVTKAHLDQWINGERFPAFPRLTSGGLNEMSEFTKRVVIIAVDKKDTVNSAQNDRFLDLGRLMSMKYKAKYEKDYQFVWMEDGEAVNFITMTTMRLPVILVLEPDTQLYYLPETSQRDLTFNSLAGFLSQITEGKAVPHGGTGFFQRLKRVFYDIYMTMYGVYATSVWLALLVFGLPAGIISIVCYALCCIEPVDEGELEDDDEDNEELKTRPDEIDSSANNDGDSHLKKD